MVYVSSGEPGTLSRDGHIAVTSIVDALENRRKTLANALAHLINGAQELADAAILLVETLRSGHKVLIAGNGGSAAEAQHFAAELVGRFKRDRAPYAALALTTDTAILTAVSNDYGYADVFSRQVRALGQPDDLLVVFSTSGESENIVRAAAAGRHGLLRVLAIVGDRPCSLESLADIALRVQGVDTATAQELHMIITHLLCDIVEAQLCEDQVHDKQDTPSPLLTSSEEGGCR